MTRDYGHFGRSSSKKDQRYRDIVDLRVLELAVAAQNMLLDGAIIVILTSIY